MSAVRWTGFQKCLYHPTSGATSADRLLSSVLVLPRSRAMSRSSVALSRLLTSLVIARSFLILRGEVSSAGLTVHTDELAKRLSAVEGEFGAGCDKNGLCSKRAKSYCIDHRMSSDCRAQIAFSLHNGKRQSKQQRQHHDAAQCEIRCVKMYQDMW